MVIFKMQKIAFKNNQENSKEKYKDFDFVKFEVENYNSTIGNLKYVDCPACKNKGYIAIIENEEVKYKACRCIKQRKISQQLENCGINVESQKKFTFDNFYTHELWQLRLKETAIKYVNEFDKKWFCVSSITGSGKTMLCTIIFLELLKKGYSGKYMLWKEEVPFLINNKRSFYENLQQKYEDKMNELKNVDILYVDDLLKLVNQRDLSDNLEMLYDIVNSRYIKNKVTIISTELSKKEIEYLDMAIAGRIQEKCCKYWLSLINDTNRNQRIAKNALKTD